MIKINMLSYADKVEGQGVNSAYSELMNLLKKSKELDIHINGGLKFDIMHAHTMDPISYAKQRLSKGKSLCYVHFLPDTLDGSMHLPKFAINTYAWWVKKMYLKSDYLVTVNPNYKSYFEKLNYKKENIFYIPNFVSSKNFYVIHKNKNLGFKTKNGYKKDDFIVVGVGQLHKGKGVLDFFECAKENPDIKFLWVGGFTFGKFMEGYDEIKKIYDNPYPNLKFTGIVSREEVNKYLNISDVFFLPSYVESFALVAVEAANTEIPLILRDIDTYKSIYFNNYLKGNTVSEFSKHIRTLKDDKKTYKMYKSKSIDIKNLYSEKNVLTMWLKLYKKIYNNVK